MQTNVFVIQIKKDLLKTAFKPYWYNSSMNNLINITVINTILFWHKLAFHNIAHFYLQISINHVYTNKIIRQINSFVFPNVAHMPRHGTRTPGHLPGGLGTVTDCSACVSEHEAAPAARCPGRLLSRGPSSSHSPPR